MAIDKYASRVWRARIRDILNRDWNPIGIDWEDEYDSYVGAIAAMIRDDKPDDRLMAYLEWAEADNMGLAPFNRARALKVIAALRALGPAPESN
jgi:hypothetical protein